MPTDQEIREICARLLLAREAKGFEAAISELRAALREHVYDAENHGIKMLLEMPKRKAASEE